MTTQDQLPIQFEDAHGAKWTRARVSRSRLVEIQNREKELEAAFDQNVPEDPDEAMTVSQGKLFDVRLKAIEGFVGDANGVPLPLEEIDVSEAQHVYQAFWRNVWGLDPLGNLR